MYPTTGWEQFHRLLLSPFFLSAAFSWLMAQLTKSIVEVVQVRPQSLRRLLGTLVWRTGGMPSSHSAMTTALATSIGFGYNLASPMFVLSLFYGMVVIRDAVGVRQATGVQARKLNELGEQLRRQVGVDYEPVKEVHGHTAAEVSVGMLLGFFIGVAFTTL